MGNVTYEKTADYLVPQCSLVLIKREGFEADIRGLDLQSGACKKCGYTIKGVWQ